jgi:hypothetical protein
MHTQSSKKEMDIRKSALQKDPTILSTYLSTLPDMVEEKITTRNLSGETIITEYLAAGNKTEAAKYDPKVRYNLNKVQLVKMDHAKNATEAFIKKGNNGLEEYRKKVFEIGYYIKGKYPQYVKEQKQMPNWIKVFFSYFKKKQNVTN